MTDLVLLLQAVELAARAHAGQNRKGGQVPYVNHPIEVARLVAEDGRGADAVIAALLHDVVEDGDVTIQEIEGRFGPTVASLVNALTDCPEWEALPRAERKALQATHIADASADAQAIKIADQTSNVRDVARLPEGWAPGKAEAYVAETGPVVAACREAAPELATAYDRAVQAARNAIARRGGS